MQNIFPLASFHFKLSGGLNKKSDIRVSYFSLRASKTFTEKLKLSVHAAERQFIFRLRRRRSLCKSKTRVLSLVFLRNCRKNLAKCKRWKENPERNQKCLGIIWRRESTSKRNRKRIFFKQVKLFLLKIWIQQLISRHGICFIFGEVFLPSDSLMKHYWLVM